MVKVKVISRSKIEWAKDRASEVPRAMRNYDPVQNHLAKQTEYARAVRAAKLDRMFAKPFVAALAGHHDTVQSIALDPTTLGNFSSGGADGELILWRTVNATPRKIIQAHRHSIDGIAYTPDGVALLSASRDRTVKLWDTDISSESEPIAQYLGESPFAAVDHHWKLSQFVTAGVKLELWDINRTLPIHKFEWGDDTVTTCSFNKIETDLVMCCMSDRGVCVFDTRTKTGHTKIVMEMSASCASWSPMDPNSFVVGSDDWNCYLFDLRVSGRPRNVFQGHTHAVTCVDFAPTGTHFVAGSQDSTIRIWKVDQLVKSNSSDMFHTKRMAKVYSVKWSLDNKFVLSGSEDAVVRVWKSDPSTSIRPPRGPEENSLNYMRALRDKYSTFEEVRKIINQRNTPKAIKRRQVAKKKIGMREVVNEMSRKKSDDLKPLAKKKVVQVVK